jgi:hypothetical protein
MGRPMKNYIIILSLIGILSSFSNAADRKLAQTGMKFLSTSLDARVSALGEAFTAAEGYSAMMFHNPAGMAFMDKNFQGAFGRVEFIADITYTFGSAAYRPFEGQYGVFGLTFISVDYGDLIGTVRAENEQGFLETGVFNPLAFAFGLGYSKSLTDQVSIGGNVKYVKQDLAGGIRRFGSNQEALTVDTEKEVMVFDFGILYKTGFRSLNFGMSVRNFSPEIEYFDESFQLPLTFRIGFAVNVFDIYPVGDEAHSLFFTVDATHPRDYAEQIGFGAEYVFMDLFSIRAGYSFPNDEHGFTAGAGFQQEVSNYYFGIDYAYTPFGIFGDVHRFTLNFAL